jgi:outer membrane receptor protein involved in Fe transport
VSQGRLHKVAAITIAALGIGSSARADGLDGLFAIAKGSRQGEAQDATRTLEFSQANALGRWNLSATAARTPWDPTDPLQIPRFDSRQALGGDSTHASLAFDWQRKLSGGRLEAAAFARASSIEIHGGERLYPAPERFEQRDRRSLFGAAARWSGDASVGAFDAHHAVGVRLRSEWLDADGALALPGRAAIAPLREDRLQQTGAGVSLENTIQLSDRIRTVAGLRYDGYRFGVKSDLAGHSGELAGGVFSPHLALIASLPGANELFVHAGRGFQPDDPRSAGAALDPRSGAPIAKRDPLATIATTEAGWRGRWLPGVETAVSLLRMKSGSELILTGDTGLTEFMRPTVRQGLQVAARYEPSRWLALDFQASGWRARFADGAAEYIPGAAERSASAAATLRVRNGWTASLLVNSFGKRPAVDGGSASLKATSFVNARLARNLSKKTRITFDVFNVFDQRIRDIDQLSTTRIWSQSGADSFLFNPAEPRGFRIKLRTTF